MKLKKAIALITCVVTAFTSVALTGCNKAPKQDGKTINLMMHLSGYGTQYVKDVATKFEEAYATEGYKVNFLEPRTTFTGSSALSEMRLDYDENGFDIVIPGGVTIKQGVDEEYGRCIAELDDLYEVGAINFDRTESDKPFKDLISERLRSALTYNGHYYSFGVTESVTGLVYNQKVLERYGIEKAPVTSNELFKQFDIILEGNADYDGIRPVTWGGANAYGYSFSTLYGGLSQLVGADEFAEFFDMNHLLTADGKIKADGWKFYEDNAKELQAVIKDVTQKFDVLYSYTGSKEQYHTDAHAQLVTGKTAFMQDGEYFYTEVQEDFPSYLKDIRMAPTPIVSYLGVKLNLCGTTHAHVDGKVTVCDNCDAILSYMCSLYDSGKDSASIKSETQTKFSITLTDEQVNHVVEARATTHGDSAGGIYIMEQSPVKDICKLFIRMLASDDAAEIFAKYGMLHRFGKVDATKYENEFIKDCAGILSRRQHITTSRLTLDSVRANTNMFIIPPYTATLPVDLNNEMGVSGTVDTRDYDAISNTTLKKVQSQVKDHWADMVALGGYEVG